MPYRVPGRVPSKCLSVCLTVCLPSVFPCAFALLRRATQRVWGLGEALYLDKIHIIAPIKEAVNELINLDLILEGVSGAPDDPFGGWNFYIFAPPFGPWKAVLH